MNTCFLQILPHSLTRSLTHSISFLSLSDSPQLPTDPSEDPGPALESEEIRPVPWSDWLEIRVQQDKQTLEGNRY